MNIILSKWICRKRNNTRFAQLYGWRLISIEDKHASKNQ